MATRHQFFKFPRTQHVKNLGAATRDDLIMDGSLALLALRSPYLTIEEKIDGANLGISVDARSGDIRFQKRGHWIVPSSEAQYTKLGAWAKNHKDVLSKALGSTHILYGEWLCARHTVAYDKLPDWFVAFDVFDITASRFLGRAERDRHLAGSGISTVRTVHSGPLDSIPSLVALLMATRTAYCTGEVQAEGLYLRVDEGGFLKTRAKLVHPDFTQAIEEGGAHWSKRIMVPNVVRTDLWDHDGDEAEAVVGEPQQDVAPPPPAEPAPLPRVPTTKHAPGPSGPVRCEAAGSSAAPRSSPAPAVGCLDGARPLQGATVGRPVAAPRRSSPAPTRPSQGANTAGSNVSGGGGRVCYRHGVMCLIGPALEAVADKLSGQVPEHAQRMRQEQFGALHHMTLLSPSEVSELTTATDPETGLGRWESPELLVRACVELLDLDGWLPVGLGSCTNRPSSTSSASSTPTAYFCVACWPSGEALRLRLGLPARSRQFHITLGFSPADLHGPSADKGLTALLVQGPLDTATQVLLMPLATSGPCASAILLTQALIELEAIPFRPEVLRAAKLLVEAAMLLLPADKSGPSSSGGLILDEAAVLAVLVAACGRALRARLLGLEGDFEGCAVEADGAIEGLTQAQSACNPAAPASSSPPGRPLLCAYGMLLKGKALFGLGRAAEAEEAFRAALAVAKGCGGCADDEAEGVPGTLPVSALALLVHKMGDLWDARAARSGVSACCKLGLSPPGGSAASGLPLHCPAHRRFDHGAEEPSAGSQLHLTSALQQGRHTDPRARCVVPAVAVDGGEVADVTLPRNTSWVVPGQLLGASTPKSRDQIHALASLGVRLVVTLTEETPLPASWFPGTRVENLFVPVPNYEPPSAQEMDRIMAALEACVAAGGAAVVHCGGGKGRAGTAIACYMCKHGLSPRQVPAAAGEATATARDGCSWEGPQLSAEDAVRVLREMRPGSIETDRQLRFVGEYSRLLWKAHAAASAAAASCCGQAEVDVLGSGAAPQNTGSGSGSGEPAAHVSIAVTTQPECDSSSGTAAASTLKAEENQGRGDQAAADIGRNAAPVRGRGGTKGSCSGTATGSLRKGVKLPKLLLLVGLPGSGKSSFAEALVASGSGWVRICQDECGGSRRTCESAFEHAALRGSDHGRHVILDRCNATVEERRCWLDLALISKRGCRGVVAVHFDVTPEECIVRVAARVGHLTLPPHRGARAVASFAYTFQAPTTAEGFERVHAVRSFEEANALLASLGASAPPQQHETIIS